MKIFPMTTKNRIPDPSEILALEFKGEFQRWRGTHPSVVWPSHLLRYRCTNRGLTATSLGGIAARLPTGLRQASPATCRASVARYGQPCEKRSVRGEPAG